MLSSPAVIEAPSSTRSTHVGRGGAFPYFLGFTADSSVSYSVGMNRQCRYCMDHRSVAPFGLPGGLVPRHIPEEIETVKFERRPDEGFGSSWRLDWGWLPPELDAF